MNRNTHRRITVTLTNGETIHLPRPRTKALCDTCNARVATKRNLCEPCHELVHDRESPYALTDGQWVKDRRGIHVWMEGATA